MMMVSRLDQYHLAPVTKLLLKPRMKRSKMATRLVIQIKLLFSLISLALATMVGIRGKNPKKQKLKNVTKLFLIGFSSSAISCNSSIIMTARNPSLLVLRICTISSDTSGFNPISLQMWIISFFSASKSDSISARSRSSSAFMYSASLFVARQSAMAIEMASAKSEEKPKARIALASEPEAKPERATQRVVMMPSRPPQTADLMYSPAVICFYWPSWPEVTGCPGWSSSTLCKSF